MTFLFCFRVSKSEHRSTSWIVSAIICAFVLICLSQVCDADSGISRATIENLRRREPPPPKAPMIEDRQTAPMHATDRQAIKDFIAALPSLLTVNPGWSATSEPLCSWTNLACDNGSSIRRVTTLSVWVPRTNTGFIPDSIGNMTSLIKLYMRGDFSRGIPSTIQRLTKLETLWIYANHHMDVAPFPSWIGQLSNLVDFQLEGTSLSGQVDPSISNLTQLYKISFTNNYQMNSTFPQISNAPILECLILSNSNFYGEIPSWLGSLTNLIFIEFDGNQFSGEIPSSIGTLPYLYHLSVPNNSLTQSIPSGFSSLSLFYADFSSNYLQGNVEQIFGNMPNLTQCNMTLNLLECSEATCPVCCSNYVARVVPSTTSTISTTATTATTSTTTSTTTSSSSSSSSSSTTTPRTVCRGFLCPCGSDFKAIQVFFSLCRASIWDVDSSIINNGNITVAIEDTLIVRGNFTQTSFAVTTVYVNSTSNGIIDVQGDAKLGGKLVLVVEDGAKNLNLTLVKARFLSAKFASITVVNKDATSKCEYKKKTKYTKTSMLMNLSLDDDCDGNNRKIIIIATTSSIGGVIVLAVIATIALVLIKTNNPFSRVFKAQLKHKSHGSSASF